MPKSIWVAAAIFALLSALSAILSTGFLETDACTHYLSAHFALRQPHRFLSVWDRPLFMLLYSLPAAYGGILGARLVSLVMALGCAWCGWRIASKLGMKRPELAFIFVLAEPLLFLHSFAEMTELCFALLIGLAFLAYMDRRWGAMALLVAISPLGRPEGFGFLFLAGIALIAHRRWRWLAVLPLALLTWTTVGWVMWGQPDYGHGILNLVYWLPGQWPYSEISTYDKGPLLFWQTQQSGQMAASFLMRLPVVVSPVFFPFMLAGTAILLWHPWQKLATHHGRCAIFAAGLPWGILAVHSYLWWRGRMASSGELRYLLVAAPLWGLLGAIGWEKAFALAAQGQTLSSKLLARPVLFAGIAAMLPVLANCYFHIVPLHPYDDDLLARDLSNWYLADATLQQKYPRLVASHPAVYLYLDMSPTDRNRSLVGGKSMVQQKPPGVMFVWDNVFSTHNADPNMCVTEAELEANGWQKIRPFTRNSRTWEVYLSPNPRR